MTDDLKLMAAILAASQTVLLAQRWLKSQVKFSRSLGVDVEDGVESIMFFTGPEKLDAIIDMLEDAAGVLLGLAGVANDA